MEGYVTRTEAAQMLGVTEQTVSNLHHRNKIRRKTVIRDGARRDVYCEEDVKKAMLYKGVVEESKDIKVMLDTINVFKNEVRREYVETMEEYKQAKARFKTRFLGEVQLVKLAEIMVEGVKAISLMSGRPVDDRETRMLTRAMIFESYEKISRDEGVTSEWVRQTVWKAIRTLLQRKPAELMSRMQALEEENRKLKDENSRLVAVNNRLSREAEIADRARMMSMEYREGRNEYINKHLDSLSISVRELGLTARSVNCLLGHGIDTVAELVYLNPKKLLRIRCMGKTSVAEIEKVILKLGLRWDAPVEPMLGQESMDYLRRFFF